MRTLNSSNINTSSDSPHHHPHPRRHPPPRRSKTPTVGTSSSATATTTPQARPNASAKFPADAHHIAFLDHQNQHVLAVTTTTTKPTTTAAAKRNVSSSSSSSSASHRMPPGDSRPRPPQLSAAAAKTVGRTPLTPKIAAPLVRRTTGNSIATIGNVNRDDTASPPTPYLANGFASRSGSRQATPSGTPNPERSNEGWDHRPPHGFDAGRQPSQGDSSTDNADSKFFYASAARTSNPQPSQQRPSSSSQKPATFFYANGVTAEAKRTMTPPVSGSFTPKRVSTPEPAPPSKFFYANGAPNVSSKPTLHPSGPSSSGSNSSKMVTSRPSTSSSTSHGHAMLQRPMSPVKLAQQQIQPVLKGSPLPPINNSRQQISSPPLLTPATMAPPSKRRVSIESAPRATRGHARTGSVPAMDSWTSPKFPASPTLQFSEPTSTPGSPGLSQPAMTMASILRAAEDLPQEDSGKDESSYGELQSPTKSTHSVDPVSELVTNARRERKVQDLEITNASLEAINRTLERQLRKQTAELRRYKRLSRSGRLSMTGLSSMASSRMPSTALPEAPIGLSDLSDGDDDDDFPNSEDEEEPDSLEDSELSGTESTSTADITSPIDDKALARRNRDERRLQLDLTKHRELLVDSQKINQSLKRCLHWTEVLIKEGQKALEYSVRVSDVEFGGHVLAPPDEDEDDEEAGDVSQDEDTLKSYRTELEPSWGKNSQDRDSGIELPAESV